MIAFLATSVSMIAAPASATNLDPWGGDTGASDVGNLTGLGNEDPRDIVATVINVIMGFLGIVAVIIILIGGFKWMTAGGNEDKVAEARKLIMAGFIGLIIVLASYAIVTFVIGQLLNATNAA